MGRSRFQKRLRAEAFDVHLAKRKGGRTLLTQNLVEILLLSRIILMKAPRYKLRKLCFKRRLQQAAKDRLVMHHHKTFQENMHLSSFFKILMTSTDKDNKVTAVQWHPEKNAFEWGLSMIPHLDDAIQVTQHFANFFVSEARKSSNRLPIRDVLDNLIYNYTPAYCGKAGKGYDEVHIFTDSVAQI
ncbi:gamma-glutamyl hydrolase 2-like protein [Tanacetum coccineum]